ncbi:hypothetical protein [Methylorubrum sp. SB2]|uniref:hypothetical protein n=1 Tax=Methylorubrum subtropicum TaxID=3138812 RepID=UPI00313D7557
MSFPESSLASATREGRRARYRGDPAEANPYPEGSDDHAAWKRAFEAPDGEAAEAEAPGGRAG